MLHGDQKRWRKKFLFNLSADAAAMFTYPNACLLMFEDVYSLELCHLAALGVHLKKEIILETIDDRASQCSTTE